MASAREPRRRGEIPGEVARYVMVPMPADARSVLVAPGRLERWIAGFGARHGEPVIDADAETVRLTGTDGALAWIAVPFPPLAERGDPVAALVEHAMRRRRIGVLLVRRGGHAAGVFDGAELISSKVGSSYVQGTTKAGGWSQQRYARRRANQAQAAFAAAADDAVRVLVPHEATLDALVCGGDRRAVDTVLADSRLAVVAALRARRTPPAGSSPAESSPAESSSAWAPQFLSVPDPRLRVLRATPEQFLGVPVRLLP